MNRLRMAVVGVGSLGRHHARILSGLEGVQLVGVVDARPSHGQDIAAEFDTQWFADADQLPADLDGVVVATPTVFHHETAAGFLSRGIPTLVEKPLASSVREAEALQQLAARHDTVLQVGHIERFNPAMQIVADRVREPLYLRFQRVSPFSFRSMDIGVVHDLMIHDIDLAIWLVGEMPVSVEAFGAVTIGPHEDTAMARLRMPGGAIVDITSSRVAPAAERTAQIWGTRGCVSVDMQSREVTCWHASGQFRNSPALVHAIMASTSNPMSLKDRVFGEWIQEERIQADSTDALTAELKHFVSCIRRHSVPQVSGVQAVQAMQVADQVLSGIKLWSYQTDSAAPQTSRRAA